jgi:hypothetical protein
MLEAFSKEASHDALEEERRRDCRSGLAGGEFSRG